MVEKKRIGILTSGGDCPGLNAAIRAATKAALVSGYEVIGIRNGWQGLLEDQTFVLDKISTSGILDQGGTILGSSRLSPLTIENGPEKVMSAFKKFGFRSLVVLGGEGTLSVTSKLHKLGLPVVGIPKTIDNDVAGTDYAIGFQTAVQIATDALDRLRSTAESHHRVMILEVMGRNSGWIATYAGMANGADAILVPEIPVDGKKLDDIYNTISSRSTTGKRYSMLVVAEGTLIQGKRIEKEVLDTFEDKEAIRYGGAGNVLGELIEKATGIETRVTTLGYVQRGGTPVSYDRTLATAFGVKAVRLIERGRFGMMAALHGNSIGATPLSEVQDKIKTLDQRIYRLAKVFFG
jgi:ATP-dependent phosphofructokinase / diphosphate-dependent phosphofructokinase